MRVEAAQSPPPPNPKLVPTALCSRPCKCYLVCKRLEHDSTEIFRCQKEDN